MKGRVGFGLLLCCMCRFGAVDSATSMDIDRLVLDLQKTSSKMSRPPTNQSILTVYVNYFMNALREYDEVAERFSSIGNVVITWIDDRLAWDPIQYGGLSKILLDNTLFWTPPINVQNSADSLAKIGHQPYVKVMHYADGTAVVVSGEVITALCSASLTHYPWDIQSCPLVFSIYSYERDEVILRPFQSSSLQDFVYYTGNGLWDMLEKETLYSMYAFVDIVSVEFKMARKPLFVIVNVIIPIVFMSILNVLVFLIPAESGERVSYCLTVLLSIAVFLTLVADTMPKSSTSISYLSFYLVFVLGHSVFMTMGTIFSLRIYFRNNEVPLPGYLRSIVLFSSCRKDCFGRRNYVIKDDGKYAHKLRPAFEMNAKNLNPTPSKNESISRHVNVLKEREPEIHALARGNMENIGRNKSISNHETTLDQNQRVYTNEGIESSKSDRAVTWKDVSDFIDAILFIFSICVVLVLNAVFFTIVPQ